MKNSFLQAAMNYPWRERSLQLIRDTPIEAAIGAIFLATVFGAYSYNENYEREGYIPVAFSEIGKITRQVEAKGEAVPPLTKFYAETNDALMKIFEANNIALESNRSHARFALELEVKADRGLRIHKQLGEYRQEIPEIARKALDALDHLVRAGNDIPDVAVRLSKVWDYDSEDIYREEEWTEEECDASGKNCRDVKHTEEVYDHTIHDYTYHREDGEKADRVMSGFLAQNPSLTINEVLIHTEKSGVDNEYAIEKSMKRELKGAIPTQEQSLAYANIWATGSTLEARRYDIMSSRVALSGLSSAWHVQKQTAQSSNYPTYSRTDKGPREYQTIESASYHAKIIGSSISAITNGIHSAAYAIPALDQKVRDYIGVVSDGKSGNADKLRSEIMDMATETYKKNFENGLDVEPFKWGEVALYTLLGGVLGGAAGFGVDYYGDYRRGRKFHP